MRPIFAIATTAAASVILPLGGAVAAIIAPMAILAYLLKMLNLSALTL
jgi:hypothetical protein